MLALGALLLVDVQAKRWSKTAPPAADGCPTLRVTSALRKALSAGKPARYTVTIRNQGAATTGSGSFSVELPENVVYVSSRASVKKGQKPSPPQPEVDSTGRFVTWRAFDLTPRATASFRLKVLPRSCANATVTFHASWYVEGRARADACVVEAPPQTAPLKVGKHASTCAPTPAALPGACLDPVSVVTNSNTATYYRCTYGALPCGAIQGSGTLNLVQTPQGCLEFCSRQYASPAVSVDGTTAPFDRKCYVERPVAMLEGPFQAWLRVESTGTSPLPVSDTCPPDGP